MNIQKILVPVDGSTASFEAFMWACELASRFQAQVHMVYMVDARHGPCSPLGSRFGIHLCHSSGTVSGTYR